MSRAIQTLDPNGRRVLDVSGLPDHAMDARSPVWWGNLLAILIESTTVVLLAVTYLYLRRNTEPWPPVAYHTTPPNYRPVPALLLPTIELLLVLGSCVAMYLTDIAARRGEHTKTARGVLLMLGVAVAVTVMRFFEFRGVIIRWDENAYGSVVWWLLGMHLTYYLAAAAEFFIMALWLMKHELDEPHALDVTLAGGYWYWVAGTWALIYSLVYFGARVL
jgi:heme/copper-type cytochrome/quinol oxidase subunit 3